MAEAANGTGRLPLSALLSQVLVPFTIECDNEFERQMPHRTSNYGSTAGRGPVPGWYRGWPLCSTCRLAAGARRCAGRPRCRTTRWCCTAAGSPMAAR